MKAWSVNVEIRYYSQRESKHFRHNWGERVNATSAAVAARRGIALAFDDLRGDDVGRMEVKSVTADVEHG